MKERKPIWSQMGGGGKALFKLMAFFVCETLISDALVIVFKQITMLMIHMLPFNVTQQAFKDAHLV